MNQIVDGKMISCDSAYFLYCSAYAVNDEFVTGSCDGVQEFEFFVCGFDTLKEARRHSRKLFNYPGFSATWIIRRKDGEVVQPREKF